MSAGAELAPHTLSARIDQMFPRLSPDQIGRVCAQGRRRLLEPGEVLVEPGLRYESFFVITAGELEVVSKTGGAETLIVAQGPGQFTGEVSMLSGRRALVQVRARQASQVIEVEAERLLRLVQTESELGEIIMRAFILRRVELIAHGFGDLVVMGSSHCSGTLRVKEFLTRNAHPYAYVDLDREADVQTLLDRFQVGESDIPVLICRGELVLRNPSNRAIADCLGFNDAIDSAQVRDLVVLGGGPAGLAAAVYGASEGLDTLVVEANAPGGQAGTSSKIENYLGFPTGVSGQALAGRALTQALKFGAHLLIAKTAARLDCVRTPYVIEIDDATRIAARAVIVATGAQYRRLPLPNLAQFEGTGIYYAATGVESEMCGGEEVVVVGGANSAGQAAVYLARTAKRVHVLVRSRGLCETMSRYLIRRIEANPAIEVHAHTEITALAGEHHLEQVEWRTGVDGPRERRAIRHVFLMTGAIPSTRWLDGCVALDERGFIKTGSDLTPEDLIAHGWPLTRPPLFLETSLPGVFAVGDVRSGSMKRVASAVGEGSMAVAFVHQVLDT